MAKGRTPQKRAREEDGDDTRISVYTRIPIDLHDRAVDFYKAEDRPISWVIAQALAFYLDEYEASGVPPKTTPAPILKPVPPTTQPFSGGPTRVAPNARQQTGV